MVKLIVSICLAIVSQASLAAENPQVWGYGVKECREYNGVFEGWSAGQESAIVEYLRFRSWFAGIATGISLATGEDILKGVEMSGAMRRIQVYCDEHPDESFFGSSMQFIRGLSGLNG